VHERLVTAVAGCVNSLGEKVLADAGLAEDEDADVAVENFLRGVQNVPQRGVSRAKTIPEPRLTTFS
jgi:4-hydroxy-3-methylbut-2-en-1-yl diphosphate synthase IspG/GcpE